MIGHRFAKVDLVWDGLDIRLYNKRGRKLASVVPDTKWPKMFRVQKCDGTLTDMVNLTRAKDAATSHALAELNG